MRFLRISILLIILLSLVIFYFLAAEHDIQNYLISQVQHESSPGIWIILAIFGLIILSTLTGLPVLYFSVVLGFLLSFPLALGLAWLFNLVAVLLTFLMVKKVFYSYFKEKYGKKKLIQSINRRIQKYAYWTVAISRSIYIIPTNIINFSFPLSKISSRQYILGTMLGLIPESLINVLSGYFIKHQVILLSSANKNLLPFAITAISLLLMISAIGIIAIRRKRASASRINDIVPDLHQD